MIILHKYMFWWEWKREKRVLITEYYVGNMWVLFAFTNMQLHLPRGKRVSLKSKSRLSVNWSLWIGPGYPWEGWHTWIYYYFFKGEWVIIEEGVCLPQCLCTFRKGKGISLIKTPTSFTIKVKERNSIYCYKL